MNADHLPRHAHSQVLKGARLLLAVVLAVGAGLLALTLMLTPTARADPGVIYVDADAISGVTLGVDHLVWLVSAMTTAALAPFMLLLSYVLRIATVAKRTLAVGPFILRDTDRWDDADTGE